MHQSGLAMGNNLAPILATIYMNELDNQILLKSNGFVTLKRFIDDYFAFLLCIDLSGQKLLTLANNLNSAIKFTLELPNNNQLPFLDTLVTWNPDTQIFTTTLYIKPIHSQCITPWDSHGSISSKRVIVTGKVNRAIKCSTDSTTQNKSLNLITELFTANGYPKTFIKSIIRRTIHKNRQRHNKQDNEPEELEQQQFTYVKLPFINEEFKRQAIRVVKRSRIPNIRLHFTNGQPFLKFLLHQRLKRTARANVKRASYLLNRTFALRRM